MKTFEYPETYGDWSGKRLQRPFTTRYGDVVRYLLKNNSGDQLAIRAFVPLTTGALPMYIQRALHTCSDIATLNRNRWRFGRFFDHVALFPAGQPLQLGVTAVARFGISKKSNELSAQFLAAAAAEKGYES